MAVGQQELAVAVAPALPLLLAGRRVDAGQDGLVEPVDVALVQDGAAEAVLHALVAPDLASREPVAGARHLEHRRAVAVACREKDAVAAEDDRLRHAGHGRRHPSVVPQQRPVVDAQPDRALRGHRQDLAHAGQRHGHRRGVGLDVVERAPRDVARGPLVCRDRPAARAAGLHHHEVVDDERGGGHRPGQVVGPRVAQDVPLPEHVARSRRRAPTGGRWRPARRRGPRARWALPAVRGRPWPRRSARPSRGSRARARWPRRRRRPPPAPGAARW